MATFASLVYSSQVIATFISLLTLAVTGTEINAFNAFVILSLISTIRATASWNISQGMNTMADFIAALYRIQSILELENGNIHKHLEATFQNSGNNRKGCSLLQVGAKQPCADVKNSGNYPVKELAVSVQNVLGSWIGSWNKLTLKSLSLSVHEGDLVFITGPVGCGKTSRLHVILQEIPLFTGEISCQGRIAWVDQRPWVFSGTIRDNILFGNSFEAHRYNETLQACDLNRDLQRFPDGDLTRVGERGIVLSGGQRARVELARAMYYNADIYLLDDPLSAVDAKVGHHIFNECISGLLHDKTRLVTTHNLQVLKDAKNIVVMRDGAIFEKGNFSSLLKSGVDLDAIDKRVGNKDVAMSMKGAMVNEKSANETILDEVVRLETDDEDRRVGSISWSLYWKYVQAGMGTFLAGVMILFFLLVQG